MKFKNLLIISFMAYVCVAFSAEERSHPAQDEGLKTFTVRMNILIDIRKINIKDKGGDTDQTQFGNSGLALSADWENKVRAYAKANLSHLFKYKNSNRIDFNEDFKIEDFIDNAYIEVHNINNSPVAVMAGKRDLIMGLHDITEVIPLPYTFWENFQLKYDVISLTVKLADKLEITLYEGENGDVGDQFNDGEGDFNIEEKSVGVLFRVEYDIGPADMVIAYNKQKNEHLGYTKPEEKITLGFKTNLSNKVSAYLEGMHLFENPPLGVRIGDKGEGGFSTGVLVKLSDKTTLVGSYTNIDELTREYGLGLLFHPFFGSPAFKENAEVRAQIYHSEYPEQGWNPDTYIGINFRIKTSHLLYGK